MTWKMMRVFKCSLCDKEAFVHNNEKLPAGWSGNENEHGDCYCYDCRLQLERYAKGRFLLLDGDPNRVVCTNCGSSFNVDDITVDGNTSPSCCPTCKIRIM